MKIFQSVCPYLELSLRIYSPNQVLNNEKTDKRNCSYQKMSVCVHGDTEVTLDPPLGLKLFTLFFCLVNFHGLLRLVCLFVVYLKHEGFQVSSLPS